MVWTGLSLLKEQGGYYSLAGRINGSRIAQFGAHGFGPSKNNDDFNLYGPSIGELLRVAGVPPSDQKAAAWLSDAIELAQSIYRATKQRPLHVAQFAKGDRHARRDLFALADKLGVDLLAGQHKRVQEALASNHQAILEAYVARQYDKVVQPTPVLAPPELLDDDPQDQDQS